MNIESLEKELNNANLSPLYLFYGDETFLLNNCIKKIKNIFGTLLKGINYINVDSENIKSLISELETPAFGYEKKLIIVKNSNLFKKDGIKKINILAEFRDKLDTYLTQNISLINSSIILIFIENEAEKVNLFNTFEKYGVVCEFAKLKPAQIVKKLKVICSKYNVNVDEKTLNKLIEISGTSMQELINEIRKLIEYAGPNGTIKEADVDKLATKQFDSIIFEVTDYLGNKKIASALESLNNLIYQKEPIQKILITLYGHFKKLYLVKLALANNKDIAESLSLKPNQMFLISKYKLQANYFDEQTLRKLLEELINLDANSKIGLMDLQVGLEAILCRYCS